MQFSKHGNGLHNLICRSVPDRLHDRSNNHEDDARLLTSSDRLNIYDIVNTIIMSPQVLATVGGSGTRLYPLTLNQPKPVG